MSRRTLAVRLDNAGDVLLAGPALRALAAGSDELVALCGPHGSEAAGLLPGVDDVLTWHCPWVDLHPGPVAPDEIGRLVSALAARRFDTAVVFTSFHQSPLPTALVLRLAGIDRVFAISADYPGALLDVRHTVAEDMHEVERNLDLVRTVGFSLPPADSGELRVRQPLPPLPAAIDSRRPFVVLHPGTSVPPRAWPTPHWVRAAQQIADLEVQVVVTGGRGERELTKLVAAADPRVVDLGGATTLTQLAGVLARAEVVVAGNTGPGHLAAAVGTSVVSLFAPTVPAVKWAPYGVPAVVLGDQHAPCKDSRARECPIPGHPCLSSVTAEQVVHAVESLAPHSFAANWLCAREEAV